MKKTKFYDENSNTWWEPETGGSNIPALNDLLNIFNISFGDIIYEGEYSLNGHKLLFESGKN